MIKELIKDILKYFPANFVPAIVSILTIPIVTKIFNPSDYGLYILVVSLLSVSYVFTTTWINASIIRFFPSYENTGKIEEFYDTVILLIVFSTIIFSVIFGSLYALLSNKFLYISPWVVFLLFIFNSIHIILLGVLRAKRKVNSYTFFSLWPGIIGIIIGLVLVKKTNLGIEGLLWGTLISLLLIVPFQVKLALNRVGYNNKINLSIAKEILIYGLPVIIINLSGWILSLSDRYFINLYCGTKEVGIYSVSYVISERSITFISSLLLLSSDPIKFIVWEKKGIEAAQKFLSDITRIYIIIGLPAVIGVSILAPKILRLLSDPLYYGGCKIMPLVVLAGFISGFEARFGAPLDFYKRTDLSMLYFLFAAFLNVILNLVLIPMYGSAGAAISTILSYLFLILLTIITTKNMMSWNFPFRSLFKSFISSVLMGILIFVIGDVFNYNIFDLLFKIFLGVIIYFLFLLLFDEFSKFEKDNFLMILKTIKRRKIE